MQNKWLQELGNVAVLDMPPEAILQRPSIVDNALSLLQMASVSSHVPGAALRFLHALIVRLKWALGLAVDPLYVLPLPLGTTSAYLIAQLLLKYECYFRPAVFAP